MKALPIEKLSFKNLSFGYENPNEIFCDVSFEFPMNQFVWLKSGVNSGRSTLLQLLAGLQRPSHGVYFINNQLVTDLTFDEWIPYRGSMGYGFDFGGLLANRTLVENLTLPLLYHRTCTEADAIEKAHWYLDHLGGYKQRDQRPAFVPGGLRKLVCLIRAVITQPQLLLLDDPSVGLSEETFGKFIEILKKFKSQDIIKHIYISSFDEKAIRPLHPLEVLISERKLVLAVHQKESA